MPVSYGAGDLRHRLEFSKRNDVSDEWGNISTGWLAMFTVSANITARLGGETVESARLAGRQPVILTVRQSPDTRQIRTDWKATDVESGIEYNIRTAIDPDIGSVSHGQWFDMLAESGVAI